MHRVARVLAQDPMARERPARGEHRGDLRQAARVRVGVGRRGLAHPDFARVEVGQALAALDRRDRATDGSAAGAAQA